jgi:hypothetical protein
MFSSLKIMSDNQNQQKNPFASAREWASNNRARNGGPGSGVNWFWVILFVILLALIFYIYLKFSNYSTAAPEAPAPEEKIETKPEERLTIQSLRERKGVSIN